MSEQNPENRHKRVLILVSSVRDASRIQRILLQAGIAAEVCAEPRDLLAALGEGAGAILVGYAILTPAVIQTLKAVIEKQPPWSDLPVFVIARRVEVGGGSRLPQWEPLGNIAVLEKPVSVETIVSVFRTALRARERQYEIRDHLEAVRKSEEALRESEDHYRHAVELNPQVPWTATSSGQIEQFSSQWLALTGLTGEELLDDGWEKVPHPEDRPHVVEAWTHSILTGEPYDIEYRVRLKNGGYRWMRSWARPRRDSGGRIIRWYGSTEDIERRKLAEASVRESEERYRTLAESLPQLVWTALPDGACDYLSRQWVDYTGIPEAEQLEYGWLDVVLHPDDRKHTYQAWMTAVADQAPYDLEYRLRRYDGVYRWFKTRGTPMRERNGKIQRWFGTCTDIEDERRREQERQTLLDREQAARHTAELLNKVGPTLIAELDTQKLAQDITDLATQLTGAQFGAFFHNITNDQGESYTLYTLSGVPREAFSRFPMPRNTAIFGPTFRGEGVVRSADITLDPRYGKNAPFSGMPPGHLPVRSYLAVSVVSRSGEVLGGLFFGHPATDRFSEQHAELAQGIAAQAAIALDNARLFAEARRIREELEQSNVELRRANEDLNQFAFSASHDLQEPLRMVAVYSQLLQRKYGDQLDERATEYLGYAVEGAKRMELLIKDLLAYTHAVGGAEEDSGPVSAFMAAEKAIQNLKTVIDENEATIELNTLPSLTVQEVHLLQLFQNLIGNALKYRSRERPLVSISAERASEQDTMWKLSVRDNGIGIDPQYAQQVFGLFKRLHSGSYEGTGIGLAICQKIVERYRGRIWVEPNPGGVGSAFCFTLPGEAEA